MFLNNPIEFYKKLDDRVEFPPILSARTEEESKMIRGKWYDALQADFRLQAEEFERSHEYTTFLKQIDDAKNNHV